MWGKEREQIGFQSLTKNRQSRCWSHIVQWSFQLGYRKDMISNIKDCHYGSKYSAILQPVNKRQNLVQIVDDRSKRRSLIRLPWPTPRHDAKNWLWTEGRSWQQSTLDQICRYLHYQSQSYWISSLQEDSTYAGNKLKLSPSDLARSAKVAKRAIYFVYSCLSIYLVCLLVNKDLCDNYRAQFYCFYKFR